MDANVAILSSAHGRYGFRDPESESKANWTGIVYVMALLGVFCGLASVLPLERVTTTTIAMLIVLGAIPAFTRQPPGAADIPLQTEIAGTLWVVLLLTSSRWPSRTATTDHLLAALLVLPLALSGYIFLPDYFQRRLREGNVRAILAISVVTILLGFALTPILSRYRKLPFEK